MNAGEQKAYKVAEQLTEEIISMCIERRVTMKEFQMLRTALPLAIDKKIDEHLSNTKLL